MGAVDGARLSIFAKWCDAGRLREGGDDDDEGCNNNYNKPETKDAAKQ